MVILAAAGWPELHLLLGLVVETVARLKIRPAVSGTGRFQGGLVPEPPELGILGLGDDAVAMAWETPRFRTSSKASLTVAPSPWERWAISGRLRGQMDSTGRVAFRDLGLYQPRS